MYTQNEKDTFTPSLPIIQNESLGNYPSPTRSVCEDTLVGVLCVS